MMVELNKKELITLVTSIAPPNELEDDLRVKPFGQWYGGFKEGWEWKERSLGKLSEEALWALYLLCKGEKDRVPPVDPTTHY